MQKGSSLYSDAWAIKLGGSLYNSKYLIEWLEIIKNCSDRRIVIIPGGGPFADQVRLADEKYNLKPNYSHDMAILAMQQFGYLLASMSPDLVLANTTKKINQAWDASQVVIWEPYEMVRDQCRLDKTWGVTSDSLAAWLANVLCIGNLLLIKSSKIVLKTTELNDLAQSKCLDAGLQDLVNDYQINTHILHKSKTRDLPELLSMI
ncbi:MAG: amino acid kinase [Gammaproteobacteria bacterium]